MPSIDTGLATLTDAKAKCAGHKSCKRSNLKCLEGGELPCLGKAAGDFSPDFMGTVMAGRWPDTFTSRAAGILV
jgi:hypothetical protein